MKLLWIFLGLVLVICRYVARRWWQLRLKARGSRRAARGSKAPLPELPQRRAAARSEAAKDAEAEYTAKQLQQHLPVGPQYLSRRELIQQVKPTDAELALCALYSNRYYTQRRLNRASKKLGIPELTVYDQFEDRRVGLRFCTFVTPTQDLGSGCKVAAAVFAVRGTRLTKTGTVQADIQLLRDRDAELYYSQRALKHVQKHIRRLSAEQPDVQWGFFITGHSLGGFAAATCLILCDRILTCTAFESPGLTTFYHRLAAQQGGEEHWRERITNYLAIPNPINMCQKHLGRIIRVHFPRLECRTDATHVLRCTLGTAVRVLNWTLAASAGFSALCLAAGISRSALVCRMLEAWASECVLEMAVPPVAASAYWTLQSAAAMVATQLGTTLRYIMQQHSMWHMAQAFDAGSGEPQRCAEMAGWPRMERLIGTFGATVSRALLESFYATPSTEGLSVIFNRTAMVEARVRRLPGYTPMPDHDDSTSEAGAFLWRLGDAFELWEEQGDALEEEELLRECQPGAEPAGRPEEAMRVQLPSPRRSWRSAHKAAEGSPPRLPEGLPNQTGYDSDDEGELGSHEDADELEDAPEPLPAPRSHPQALFRSTQECSEDLTEDEGAAAMDAPGPRLLDGYDSDPGGADAERRARRRAMMRRSIGRRSGGHSAIRAASSLMDSLCKALGDMPYDVDRPPASGERWGSDGFEVSGLDPTESELNMTGCSAAEGPSYRSYRPSRTARAHRRSPFDCDSTSGTDAHEAYQPYRPSLRSISSLPSAQAATASGVAAAVLPRSQPGTHRVRLSRAQDAQADQQSPSAAKLSEQPSEALRKQAKHEACSSESSSAAAALESNDSGPLGTQDSSSKPVEPRKPPDSSCEEAGREVDSADTRRLSCEVDESAPEHGLDAAAMARIQADSGQDLGSWLWRPWLWAGFKRGIKRRAAQC